MTFKASMKSEWEFCGAFSPCLWALRMFMVIDSLQNQPLAVLQFKIFLI